ncbi:M10 family metallopeptidase C-terminal domain-containing protein [Pseudomonas sp. P115]|uniref:M10 family metallopeptidase C-terminal domain-containing protein n=1 Tax=Pseudomonas pisciculturae TaxID=2730413 RepID=UPI00135C50A3|nr:M10 family metallopeptidase C-terminal domain-containing protein [Pseudomonas pisciculturae]MBF6029558.1 M10 family metallopeptidase C-terminal domain-containing protein [Pseudomonas pisciculturae]
MPASLYQPTLDTPMHPTPHRVSPTAPPSPLMTDAQALEALLHSPPDQARTPKQPDANAALPTLKAALEQASARFNIATEVRKANEALQYAHPDDWARRRSEPISEQAPNVYSFLGTHESTLDSPVEIRGFVHGRDKLDVSRIRKQLNKKLLWVNQLSGRAGEMQLKYSPIHDASVLVISGNQGEPAFVAKVFGKLKETDLVT